MNKQQFVDTITTDIQQQYPGMSKKSIKDLTDLFFTTMLQGIKTDGKLSNPAFGTFKLKKQAPRVSRNPQTGEPVSVPARCTIGFKPAKKVKEEVTRECL